jgi:hypothetical protein
MNDTASLLKAIEEVLWATNQVQLTAFHENNREMCPRLAPPAPLACPPSPECGRILTLFLYLFCSALFASAKREYLESQRQEAREAGDKEWRNIIEIRKAQETQGQEE